MEAYLEYVFFYFEVRVQENKARWLRLFTLKDALSADDESQATEDDVVCFRHDRVHMKMAEYFVVLENTYGGFRFNRERAGGDFVGSVLD